MFYENPYSSIASKLKFTKKLNCLISEYVLWIKEMDGLLLSIGDLITYKYQIDDIIEGILHKYSHLLCKFMVTLSQLRYMMLRWSSMCKKLNLKNWGKNFWSLMFLHILIILNQFLIMVVMPFVVVSTIILGSKGSSYDSRSTCQLCGKYVHLFLIADIMKLCSSWDKWWIRYLGQLVQLVKLCFTQYDNNTEIMRKQ